MTNLQKQMDKLLADTYALYLKTQNYHWHVHGPNFKALHELFEGQYTDLADAVDEIAERILTNGHKAPATFSEFNALKSIQDGNSHLSSNDMVKELAQDNNQLVKDLNQAMLAAQELNDEGTLALLSDRIAAHEKARWMLSASQEG